MKTHYNIEELAELLEGAEEVLEIGPSSFPGAEGSGPAQVELEVFLVRKALDISVRKSYSVIFSGGEPVDISEGELEVQIPYPVLAGLAPVSEADLSAWLKDYFETPDLNSFRGSI